MNDREAFEKAIDANPLDAMNHLAYADWLEENGEPDEAAFRRAMGEWYRDAGFTTDHSEGDASYEKWENGLPWRVHPSFLPRWIDVANFPTTHNMELADQGRTFQFGSTDRMGWSSRAAMENSFRQQFMANRQKEQAQQMSRIAHAIRKFRSKPCR